MENDEDYEEQGSSNIIGNVLAFGLISVVIMFFTIVFFAALNNYGLGELYKLVNVFSDSGLLHSSLIGTIDIIMSDVTTILEVLDYVWLGCFIFMVSGTLIYSYNTPRQNYFNIFTIAIFGIIVFLWVGSYITQVTEWFVINIYYAVLPTISTYTPIFNWYLSNINLINLILVCLNIIANFVDLDMKRYYSRKDGDTIDEI